jgi:cytochrome c
LLRHWCLSIESLNDGIAPDVDCGWCKNRYAMLCVCGVILQSVLRNVPIGSAIQVSFAMISLAAAVAQNAENGIAVFNKCIACHQVGETAKNAVGPELNGLMGRKSGTLNDYSYSSAMKAAGIVWNEKTLGEFIASPQSKVRGTKMTFPGIKDGPPISDLIAFLKQFRADGSKHQ